MNNLLTISGATAWMTVVFVLMLGVLTPVSVATPIKPQLESRH